MAPECLGTGLELSEREVDNRLRALADARRRILTSYLIDKYPEPVPMGGAVAHIANVTGGNHQQIEVDMVHNQIPVLEQADLVIYTDDQELAYSGGESVIEIIELL